MMTSNSVTEDTPADMLEGHMDLVVHLPNDTFIHYKAERRCAVMDLLVQIAAKAKLKPSDYILQPLGQSHQTSDSFNQYDYLDYKPNTPIGILNIQVIRLIPKSECKVLKNNASNLHRSISSNNHLESEQDFKNKVRDFNNLTGTSAVDVCNKPDFQNQLLIDSQVLSRSNYISSVLPPSLSTSSTDLTITPPGTTNRQSYIKPFETTCRVQVNLPMNQLHIVRVKLSTTLQEILDIVCEERSIIPDKYVFVRPDAIYKILKLKTTIKDYGLTELTLRPKNSLGMPDVTISREDKKAQRWSTISIPALFKKKEKPTKKIIYGPVGTLSLGEWRNTQFNNSSVPQYPGRVNRSQSTVSVKGYSQYSGSTGNLNYIIPDEKENPQKFRSGSITQVETLTSANNMDKKIKSATRKKRQAPPPPPLRIQNDNMDINNMNRQDIQNISEIHEIQKRTKEPDITIAHSRTSSDSSGYHEAASVLSDGGIGVSSGVYSNYGSLPSTLPRKQKTGIIQSAPTFKEESYVHTEITHAVNVPKIAPRKKKVAPIAPVRTLLPSEVNPQSQSITDSINHELEIVYQNVKENLQISPDDKIENSPEYLSQNMFDAPQTPPFLEPSSSDSDLSKITKILEDQLNDTISVNSIHMEVFPQEKDNISIEKCKLPLHSDFVMPPSPTQHINDAAPASMLYKASNHVDESNAVKENSAIKNRSSKNEEYVAQSPSYVESNNTMYFASRVENPNQSSTITDHIVPSIDNRSIVPPYLKPIDKIIDVIEQDIDIQLGTDIVADKSMDPRRFSDENLEHPEIQYNKDKKLNSRQSISSISDPPLLDDEGPCDTPKYHSLLYEKTLPFIVSSDNKDDSNYKSANAYQRKVSIENSSKEQALTEVIDHSIECQSEDSHPIRVLVSKEHGFTKSIKHSKVFKPESDTHEVLENSSKEYHAITEFSDNAVSITDDEKNSGMQTSEAPLEIMKKLTFHRIPDVKYSTWNERPKTKVSLKSDSDYKISNQENSVKNGEDPGNLSKDSLYKIEIEPVTLRNKKINTDTSADRTMSHNIKTSSFHRSSLNVDMYKQISQVPIRKSKTNSLENRKSLSNDATSEFPFGQNTLRRTGLRKMFIEEENKQTETYEHNVDNKNSYRNERRIDNKSHTYNPVIINATTVAKSAIPIVESTVSNKESAIPVAESDITNIESAVSISESAVPIVKSAVLKKHVEVTKSEYPNTFNNPIMDPRASLLEQIRNKDLMKNLKKTKLQ